MDFDKVDSSVSQSRTAENEEKMGDKSQKEERKDFTAEEKSGKEKPRTPHLHKLTFLDRTEAKDVIDKPPSLIGGPYSPKEGELERRFVLIDRANKDKHPRGYKYMPELPNKRACIETRSQEAPLLSYLAGTPSTKVFGGLIPLQFQSNKGNMEKQNTNADLKPNRGSVHTHAVFWKKDPASVLQSSPEHVDGIPNNLMEGMKPSSQFTYEDGMDKSKVPVTNLYPPNLVTTQRISNNYTRETGATIGLTDTQTCKGKCKFYGGVNKGCTFEQVLLKDPGYARRSMQVCKAKCSRPWPDLQEYLQYLTSFESSLKTDVVEFFEWVKANVHDEEEWSMLENRSRSNLLQDIGIKTHMEIMRQMKAEIAEGREVPFWFDLLHRVRRLLVEQQHIMPEDSPELIANRIKSCWFNIRHSIETNDLWHYNLFYKEMMYYIQWYYPHWMNSTLSPEHDRGLKTEGPKCI